MTAKGLSTWQPHTDGKVHVQYVCAVHLLLANWLPNQFWLHSNAEWGMFKMHFRLLKAFGSWQRGSGKCLCLEVVAFPLSPAEKQPALDTQVQLKTWQNAGIFEMDTETWAWVDVCEHWCEYFLENQWYNINNINKRETFNFSYSKEGGHDPKPNSILMTYSDSRPQTFLDVQEAYRGVSLQLWDTEAAVSQKQVKCTLSVQLWIPPSWLGTVHFV